LTANLQLQPLPQLVPRIVRARPLGQVSLAQVHQTQHSPGGAAIDSPSVPSLPIRAYSATNRACDEASDVLSCDPGWTRTDRRPRRAHPRHLGHGRYIGETPNPRPSRIPVTRGRSIRLRRRLVKGRRRHRIRTPSIDENPSPGALRAHARNARDHEDPCRGQAPAKPISLLACSWLSPLRSGFSASSPAKPPWGRARRLDPVFTVPCGTVPAAVRRPGPSAARRLLQPKHPASTTAGSTDPRCLSPALSRPSVRFRAPPARVGLRPHRLSPGERLLPGIEAFASMLGHG